jgi:hypothetical protein
MILTDGDITLEQTEDKSYLVELMGKDKYHVLDDKKLEYVRFLWVGRVSGVLGGVIYFCYFPPQNWWTFDAYKEDERLKKLDNQGNFSYRAGKLAIDWFFEKGIAQELFTGHDIKNRGATIICKRLGFKFIGYLKKFVVLKRGG